MGKEHTKIILCLFLSVFVVSCGNQNKQVDKTEQITEKSLTTKEKKTYSEKELYLEADSLQIVQVNPNVTRKMAHLDDLMVTIVEFSNGPMAKPDPFHSHPHEQMTYIAEGECIVFIGDTQKRLKQGDVFAVPSNVPHSVQSLSKTLKLVDSFSPIREDFLPQQ